MEDAGIRAISFIAEHGAAILAELRKGPLSLTEALKREWIRLDTGGISDLGALVGTYCDPSMLGTDLNIVVRLGNDREVFENDGIGRLTFDELVMVMEDA